MGDEDDQIVADEAEEPDLGAITPVFAEEMDGDDEIEERSHTWRAYEADVDDRRGYYDHPQSVEDDAHNQVEKE